MQHASLVSLCLAATTLWSDSGKWAYDTWCQLNDLFFHAELRVGPIDWGLIPGEGQLGHYESSANVITLRMGLIRPSSTGGWLRRTWEGVPLASDVLLHQMIHQRIFQVHGVASSALTAASVEGDGDLSHNNRLWVAEVNRLAPLLGLLPNAAVIMPKRVNGIMTWPAPPVGMAREELSTWPYGVRPEFYSEQSVA